ncbi:MAG: hypothetical protein HOQ22_10910 [Nocardioidaceae bacterium]|nr:hypothetical protein [Nocardioidaceae bacterium]NUS51535.1 hypothetical protein [Nocardioidaceae bacterium]
MPSQPSQSALRSFSNVASTFWEKNTLGSPRRVILVEAMAQDLRYTLRNLTVANALRRIEPAELVVYSGADEEWNQVVWAYFSLEDQLRLANAYGARDAFDIHAVVDDRVAGRTTPVTVAGVELGGELPESGISPDRFEQIVYATACRMAKVARLDDTEEHRAKRLQVEARSREFARVYEALFENLDVVALVSSHVDYNNFGLAVESALRHDVPVLFAQPTGGLKVYGLWPDQQQPGRPVRAVLTEEVAAFFESHVWRHRDLLRRSAELSAWRARSALGRPAWWRWQGPRVQLHGAEERAEMRRHAARITGLDAAKPTVSVFNHAVSDALGTNMEAFPDLGAWFEATAEHARGRRDVNWLFLDHPRQYLYDGSGFFDRVAERYVDEPHMRFMASLDLTKNMLVALSDLVLTVRGSVANEYPVLGIPAIQTGWSEWSHCGFTTVCDTVDDYFSELDAHLKGLLAGDALMTPEQVDRARLWTWFYRAATDVPSGLVQQWQVGQDDTLFDLLSTNMLHVESDADPAFAAVRRLWRRRDPFLTRVDWTLDAERLADSLAVVSPS